MDAVNMMAHAINETAKATKKQNGVGCAKLVVFCNAPSDNPFMAGAFHGIEEGDATINIGISGPSAVRAAIEQCAGSLDELRGHEGEAARLYFDAFTSMIHADREAFAMIKRTRRPPQDRLNALLGFAYALLVHDCCAALAAAGLDASVGFLHADRPGKPSLALDLMEEFRPLIADRLVLALINRGQIGPGDFEFRDGGAVEMAESARRAFVAAYQRRKTETVRHPVTQTETRIGLLPFVQAKLMARHIRGESPAYVPCVLK